MPQSLLIALSSSLLSFSRRVIGPRPKFNRGPEGDSPAEQCETADSPNDKNKNEEHQPRPDLLGLRVPKGWGEARLVKTLTNLKLNYVESATSFLTDQLPEINKYR